jgi:hypothetical protein
MRWISPVAIILAIILTAGTGTAFAQEEDQAGLVLSYGIGQAEFYCVELVEPEITGYELLRRSGVAIEANDAGLGSAVCRLEETGCPANNCFCECRGSDCEYWSYWHLLEGEWQYSAIGASQYRIRPGDIDGWSWGPGSVTEAIAPPDVTLAEICAPTVAANQSDSAPIEEMPIEAVATAAPPALGAEGTVPATSNWLYYVLAGVVLVGLLALVLLGRRRADEQ